MLRSRGYAGEKRIGVWWILRHNLQAIGRFYRSRQCMLCAPLQVFGSIGERVNRLIVHRAYIAQRVVDGETLKRLNQGTIDHVQLPHSLWIRTQIEIDPVENAVLKRVLAQDTG